MPLQAEADVERRTTYNPTVSNHVLPAIFHGAIPGGSRHVGIHGINGHRHTVLLREK